MSCLPEELVTWQILPLASSKTTANKTCGGLVTTLPSEFRLITNLNKMATANRTRPTDYRHFEIIRHKYLFSQGNLNCLDFFLSFFLSFFFFFYMITYNNKHNHNAKLQRTYPVRHKSYGRIHSVPRPVF